MANLRERLEEGLAGRYRLERELGRGGMATVYLAHDFRHDRAVALKVLHPALAATVGPERFQREIKLAARLQHPHILSVHDSGTAAGMLFYAMPYVEGESLRARLTRELQLDIEEAVRIAEEVAEALEHAHGAGIIHRDIKPENILLSGGHSIVADFGIARALDSAGAQRLTETGLALGTPAYMSPEQSTGARVLDARTDVYALGCVLYEMLAGEPPFTGPTAQAVLARHSLDPVPNLRTVRPMVTSALAAVVTKSLAKVPADRFASAAAFRRALLDAKSQIVAAPSLRSRRPKHLGLAVLVALGVVLIVRGRLATAPLPADGNGPIRGLAVAPLENLTGDSSQIYLAEGLTDQLVTTLAQIGALRVIGLKHAQADLTGPELGQSLGVDAVLAGSLQRSGEMVRVTLRLKSASSGRSLWARTYDGELRGILGLQDKVARAIAEEMRVSMTAEERSQLSATHPAVEPAAYQAYVRGWHFLERGAAAGGEAQFRRALAYFQRAIDVDPAYAPPFVGLALCYEELGYFALEPPRETFPRARAAALKALELDSTLGEAIASLANYDSYFAWDFSAAQQDYQRALKLSPKYARGHLEYAAHLTAMGRINEAVIEMKEAQDLDPLSVLILAAAARPYWNGRQYAEAIAQSQKALQLDASLSRPHYWLGMSYAQTGRLKEAVREFEETLRGAGPIPAYRAAAAYGYALAGERGHVRLILDSLESEARTKPISRLEIAAVYAGLGERDSCLNWLAKAYEQHDAVLRFLAVDPRFGPFRYDVRFTELLRRIGLPDSLTRPRNSPALGKAGNAPHA